MVSLKNITVAKLFGLILLWACLVFFSLPWADAQSASAWPRDNLVVAAVQYKAWPGQPERNRNNLRPLVIKAADQGAGLVVLPELCITGMIWDNASAAASFAEPVPGLTTRYFGEIARARHLYIALGLIEAQGPHLYNTQVLIGPDGNVAASYQKVNLYLTDRKWAKPGRQGYMSVKTDLGRIGLGICYDINFDDFIDFHVKNGTDILAFSTNWVGSGPPFDYWKSRIDQAGFAFVAANNYGRQRHVEFSGGSVILDRQGRESAVSTVRKNTVIWGVIQ